MPTIADIRQQYPQYHDMSDQALADALHSKFYADMPRAEFEAKIGIQTAPPEQPPQASAPAEPSTEQPYSGTILPFTRDETGIHFDPNVGFIGPIYRAIKAPGDVLTGKLDPNSPEGLRRASEMALVISPTSVASKALPGIAGAVTGSMKKAKVEAPSAEALKAAANAGYNQVRNAGIDFKGGAVKDFADAVSQGLNAKGYIGELAPKTHAIINKLANPPAGATASLDSLDAARKVLGDIAGSPDKTEASAARQVISELDRFLGNPDPSALSGVSTGLRVPAPLGSAPAGADEAARAAATLRDARGNAAARFRSDALTGIEDAANLRASAANSGRNLGNTIRSRLASLLINGKETRGFTPQEVDAITQVVKGTPASNTSRYVSNLLGAGGGLGQALMAGLGAAPGAMSGNAPAAMMGAALPTAIGATARTISNRLTARQLALVDELTRKRSPLYAQLSANAPANYSPAELRAAIVRSLMAAQVPQN
jgi:hypothetical protein